MGNDRYTLSALVTAVKNPSVVQYEVERLISKCLFQRKHGSGTDVMAEDWDNLIILDAMRADYFKKHNTINGEFNEIVSMGSGSKEFIDNTFAQGEFHDTIYVTSNPFVERLSGDEFFRVYYTELFEEWDSDLKTIPPQAVVDATVKMHEKYPNKRIISHFMQPHAPFIGPTGRELFDEQNFGVFNPKLKERDSYDVPHYNIPAAVEKGIISEEQLKKVYEENVEIAIEHAHDLVQNLGGRTAITADHGEMLGDKVVWNTRYGHGDFNYSPELRVVPWYVVEGGERREIESGDSEEFATLEDDVRDSRLSALGYVEG